MSQHSADDPVLRDGGGPLTGARLADPAVAAAANVATADDAGDVTVSGDVIDSIIVSGDQNNVVGTLIVGSDAGVQELEIALNPVGSGGYTATGRIGDERRPVQSSFQPPFSELELRGAQAALRRGKLDEDAREYGNRLFQALFQPPLLELYSLCRDRPNPLRLRLVLNDPWLQELPWELLWDGQQAEWLARRGTVVRSAAEHQSARSAGPVTTLAPFRVLIVDLHRQKIGEAEINAANLERAVGDLERDRRIAVSRAAPETAEALEAAVARAAGREQTLDVLHLLDWEAEDERWPVSALAELMQRYDVPVAAFSTSTVRGLSTFQAVKQAGASLTRQHAATVIGVPLSGEVEHDARVSRLLYVGLSGGEPVDQALAEAVRRRSRGSDGGEPSGDIPFCFVGSGDVARFEVQSPPPTPLTWRTWRPWVRERVSVAGVATASLALAASVAVGGPPLWSAIFPEPIPPMRGSMNIAVAEFGQMNATSAVQRWAKGAELASRFAGDIDEKRAPLDEAVEWVPGGAVDIRGPEMTGRLSGDTAEDRERAADRLATSIQADLIVSGNVSADGRRFLPEIFVSGRQGLSTIDPGFYAFGEIALRPDTNLFASVNDQQELQQRLVQSTRSVVEFVLGFNAYATRSYSEAAAHFQEAASAAGVDLERARGPSFPADGLETLMLLMGDVASKQAAATTTAPDQRQALLERARSFYERSLAVDPEFGRAYVGLAEDTFLQAVGSCPRPSASVNATGLKGAIDLYKRAQAALHQSEIANIGPKAHFGMGRAIYCLARVGAEGYTAEQARSELQRVLDAYNPNNRRLKDWAIEAHATIGGIALVDEDYPAAGRAFAAAIELSSSQSAQEMGGEAERRYLFCRNLGRAEARLVGAPGGGPSFNQVAREPACQQQYQTGFSLGKQDPS